MGLGGGELIESLLYRRRSRGRTLACNESSRYRVPVLKHFFKLSADEASRYPSSEKTEREGIFYPVFEGARGRALWLERVCMLPIGEWAGNLDIAEIAVLFVLQMFGDPALSKWPPPEPQHDARPALDSASSLDDFDVFPRRREPFQRLRQGVPGVHVDGGSLDS